MPKRSSLPSTANRTVAILAYDGLCTFEFGIAVEVFGLPRPEMGPDWYRAKVVAVEPGPLSATGGITVAADGDLSLLADAGTIIVPGWRAAGAAVPEELCLALRTAHERSARLVSICSGAFVLAAAGLLSGRDATTHWRYEAILAERHPDIRYRPGLLYVDHGDVLTSAGSAAGLDLCLHIVRKDFGAAIANQVAQRLVLSSHRDGAQKQVLERPVPTEHEGRRLSPLLDRLRQELDREHALRDLADSVGMSLRTFIRRFQELTGLSPGEWLLRERVARAEQLLAETGASVEDVATSCGFPTAAALRYHFRNRVGMAPNRYRQSRSA
ncbi:transcriptional regulator FtrA [Niveispirillum sp. KHB5.9]|uniref:transcriptional regulator FtrA n=1 Tax=Niveispirillum sp. KHB5.9 TaxID=3400269 RepID=UPI003A83CC23